MNEIIQEFAEQCRSYADYYAMLSEESEQKIFERKFAEMIVLECARVAALTDCPYTDDVARQTYGHTWDMACVESAKEIRRYFGVK